MEDDEPELWVLDDDVADDADGASASPEDGSNSLASTLTSDDVAGEDWADTSWLDELAPPPGGTVETTSPAPPTGHAPGARTGDVPAPPRPASSAAAAHGAGTSSVPGSGAFVADAVPPAAPAGSPPAPAPATPAPPPPSPAATTPATRSTPADEFADLVAPIDSGETGAVAPTPGSEPATSPETTSRPRRHARRGGDVSEFLRELSRLALDDD